MERFNIFKGKSVAKKDKKIKFEQFLGIPYYVLLTILIVLPIFLLLIYSFLEGQSNFDLTFSLNHYLNFFREPLFIKSMGRSIGIAFLGTSIALMIGYPMAFLIALSKPRTKLLLILLITSPMWINMILRVLAIKQVFEMINLRLHLTEFALVVGMVNIYLPYMILPIFTVLDKMDKNLFEAASDLGATKFKTIVKVVIPLSLSGVLSGIIMVFLPMATTLVVPKYLGPSGKNLIGNIIEQAITKRQYGGYGYGAAIAVVLAIIILILVSIMKRFDKYQEAGTNENY